MNRDWFRLRWMAIVSLVATACFSAPPQRDFDVVVYGGTPSGIAAAIAAAQPGRSVALVEPTDFLGGMMTGGLSYTDFHSLESLSGFFRQYMDRVVRHYTRKHGADSRQVKDCNQGVHAEPHVTAEIFGQMLAENHGVTILLQWPLTAVSIGSDGQGVNFIRTADFTAPTGPQRLRASVFIDATYEGDLAAAAGTPCRIGRESRAEFNESLAGNIYMKGGNILEGSTGKGDAAVQCYNYRITMTQREEIRVPVAQPAGYKREQFLPLAEVYKTGKLKKAFSEGKDGALRVQRIANGKADINDSPGVPIRLSLPGENDDYPAGDAAARRRILERHRQYNLGLIFFLQNDPSLPEPVRQEASTWGLCGDEFQKYGHFPPQLYIREARRIIGRPIFTEHDGLAVAGDVRAPLHADAIAIGDYGLNCHGTRKMGPPHPDVTEGEFFKRTVPFQVPYGALIARNVSNLLVSVCVSATHVGYSCLRLEPVYVAMGEAAGLAAHLAITSGSAVEDVPAGPLQAMLHQRKAMTIYVSDVGPVDELFPAVQYFGTRGAFHRLVTPPEKFPLPKKSFGLQYTEAIPLHTADLKTPADAALIARWIGLLPSRLMRDRAAADGLIKPGMTRGELIGRLYQMVKMGS